MRQFTDEKQRQWSITVNVGTAKKVRDLVNVDLFNIFTNEATKVFSDPILLVNVLYVLVQDQCKERNVSEESFGEGLVGDAIENASTAMMEAVADFFPSSRRQIAMKTIEKSTAAAKVMTEQAMTALENLDISKINLKPPTTVLAS